MNAEIFPGVPDDFGGEPAAQHPDPGPLWVSERRQRDQETSCSCARMKFRIARATILTCPACLWDCVFLHTEQGSHGRNCHAKLPNCSPLLHFFPTRQRRLVNPKTASVKKVFWYPNPQYYVPDNWNRRNILPTWRIQTFH